MREIAARADVGVGTVFVHAKSKSDLLVLVYWEAIRDTVKKAFTTLPKGATLADELMYVFTRLFDMYARDVELSRVYVREVIFTPGPTRQEMDELTLLFFRTAAERMGAARGRGELGDHFDPVTAARNIFGLYFFALTAWLGGWVVDRKAALKGLRESVELQIEGLRPRGVETKRAPRTK
jgi:AcrR family transcriptional regulator